MCSLISFNFLYCYGNNCVANPITSHADSKKRWEQNEKNPSKHWSHCYHYAAAIAALPAKQAVAFEVLSERVLIVYRAHLATQSKGWLVSGKMNHERTIKSWSYVLQRFPNVSVTLYSHCVQVCVCVCVCVFFVCVCVCACVRESERKRVSQTETVVCTQSS